MNKQTKKNLLIAVILFVFFIVLFSYNLYQISIQGTKMAQSRQLISDNLAKESSYNKIVSLLESTKDDRNTLNNFFITEKDTVRFISDMETDAKIIGVKMVTNNLAVNKAVIKDGQIIEPAKLILTVSFSGSEDLVKKYVLLLENISYQKTFSELNLSKLDEQNWQGRATLNITMAP